MDHHLKAVAHLAPHLLRALRAGAIDLQEANELQTFNQQQRLADLPEHLLQAASRLWLFQLPVEAPVQ